MYAFFEFNATMSHVKVLKMFEQLYAAKWRNWRRSVCQLTFFCC